MKLWWIRSTLRWIFYFRETKDEEEVKTTASSYREEKFIVGYDYHLTRNIVGREIVPSQGYNCVDHCCYAFNVAEKLQHLELKIFSVCLDLWHRMEWIGMMWQLIRFLNLQIMDGVKWYMIESIPSYSIKFSIFHSIQFGGACNGLRSFK